MITLNDNNILTNDYFWGNYCDPYWIKKIKHLSKCCPSLIRIEKSTWPTTYMACGDIRQHNNAKCRWAPVVCSEQSTQQCTTSEHNINIQIE